MVDEKLVSEHYRHNRLLELIEAGLSEIGKSATSATIEDLAPADEFHTGGRIATEHLMEQLKFNHSDKLLDVGCGLGGASRFIAKTYGNTVIGIDLTDDYVKAGRFLNSWLALENSVALHQGSALDMPFDEEYFDGAYMLHVGMKIQAKDKLFSEIARTLKSGARFGVYDVMRTSNAPLTYPVPWASDESFSFLSKVEEYSELLVSAGFEIEGTTNRKDFALEFFRLLKEKNEANGGPAPLGLHLLMESSTSLKIKNMVANIVNNCISPVELVAKKI